MKIINCNVNGIRSATAKGFFEWFSHQNADILCLQEIKAMAHQIPEAARLRDYHAFFSHAEKAGYAGVALYSRKQPLAVHEGFSSVDPEKNWDDIDREGRYLQADFENLSIISVYFPSGSSSALRQARKMSFLERFLPFIQQLRDRGRELIVCGDMNIAHQRIDLCNWRGNRKNSGFLPEERAWFSRWLDAGFVDTFRQLHPQDIAYSWWSNRGQARAKNVGWRIDYLISTPGIAEQASMAGIHDRMERFSDHAPVIGQWETDL
ncbi:MAG: exodeoxyribonuclease III [Zetaproteobacteria bacterium]|nr:MAG: exodeoxyribonuclease III [Zetaproteobacteria bacterium]